MVKKIPGVPTGTVDATTNSGRRALWKPNGDLTLLVSETAAQELPEKIKSNPDADALIDMRATQTRKRGRGLLRRFLDAVFGDGEFPAVRESARLFVGHNVGSEPFWRSGEVYLMGYLLREAQLRRGGAIPAFSFYVGVGAFPGQGAQIAAEQSSQFVFINFSQEPEVFFEDMARLAQELAEYLSQESVLVEFSEKGRVSVYEYVESDRAKWHDSVEVRGELSKQSNRVSEKVWNA